MQVRPCLVTAVTGVTEVSNRRRVLGDRQARELAACPDCDSDLVSIPVDGAPGVRVIEVRHDESCPTFRRLRLLPEAHP